MAIATMYMHDVAIRSWYGKHLSIGSQSDRGNFIPCQMSADVSTRPRASLRRNEHLSIVNFPIPTEVDHRRSLQMNCVMTSPISKIFATPNMSAVAMSQSVIDLSVKEY